MAESLNPVPHLSFTPAHAVALGARLRVLEEDCHEIEHGLKGVEGICFEYADTLPESVKRTARATIKDLFRELARLQSELALRKQQIDLRRTLNARLSHMWVTLLESKAESLKGYGEVPDELRAFLDPRIDRLLELWSRLRDALGEDEK